MRKLGTKVMVVMTTMLVVAGLAFAAAPAGASVDAKASKKVCKILTGISIDPSSDPTASGGRESAAKYAKALKKAAKKVKGNIKKTLKTLANYYQRIADGDDISDLGDDAAAFAKASLKFASYVVDNCLGDISIPSIPNVSIPDIG
jgi:hypothetical protein